MGRKTTSPYFYKKAWRDRERARERERKRERERERERGSEREKKRERERPPPDRPYLTIKVAEKESGLGGSAGAPRKGGLQYMLTNVGRAFLSGMVVAHRAGGNKLQDKLALCRVDQTVWFIWIIRYGPYGPECRKPKPHLSLSMRP